MPYTMTCGAPAKATEFAYCGSVNQGITLIFRNGDVYICAQFLALIRNEFKGRRIIGGFNMTEPPPDGLGAWVKNNSREFNNGTALSPRHASFIAAIMRDAGWLDCQLEGRRVVLNFM